MSQDLAYQAVIKLQLYGVRFGNVACRLEGQILTATSGFLPDGACTGTLYFMYDSSSSERNIMAYAGKILVIDQHQPTCEFIAIALGDLGYQVESVHTPERIYAALERQEPDLILCALDVQGVSAFDLITVLRRHGMALAVPIVIMTTDPRILDTFPTQSIAGYMLKPFRLDELYELVQRYCPAKAMPLLECSIGARG